MSSQSFRFDSPFIFNPSKSEDLTSSTFGLAETKIICLYFDLNNFNFPRSFLISMLINFLINLSRLFLIEKIKEEKVARTWWKFFCISFDVGKSRRSLDSGAKRKKKKKNAGSLKFVQTLGRFDRRVTFQHTFVSSLNFIFEPLPSTQVSYNVDEYGEGVDIVRSIVGNWNVRRRSNSFEASLI